MDVYDDQETNDDQLRKITGISSDEEKQIDSKSSQEAKTSLSASETSPATSSNSGSGQNVSFSANQLRSAESGTGSTNNSSGFYNDKDKATTGGRVKNFFWGSKRRKQVTVGGGLTGVVIGGGLFGLTLFGGTGFEFIHLAQVLEHTHFGNQQNVQDSEFTKLIRYSIHIPQGEIEKTRMGYLGNKYADYYEGKLNASGLVSAYTDKFGLFDGYVIDKTNPAFEGMSDDQIKAAVEEQYGVTPVAGSEIKGASSAIESSDLVIDASSLKFKDTVLLNYNVLKQADLSNLGAAIGARLMCLRASCDWHPLSNKISNTKRAAEAYITQDEEEEQTGETALTETNASKPPDQQDPTQVTSSEQASTALTDISSGAQAANQQPSQLTSLTKDISTKLVAGGAAAVAVLCTLKGINSQADEIKQTQVVLPLIRMGIQAVAVGNQVMSGQDFNGNELSALGSQLYGKDAEGQYTGWDASESIQANLGNPNASKDVPPNGTLTSIQDGTPFAVLNDIPGLNAVCSTVGQIASGVISIAIDFSGIGALVQGLAGAAFQGIGIGVLSNQAAHWLAGKAVDVAAVGADFGNEVDFGSALGANQQAITSGGTALSKPQLSTLQSQNNLAYNKEFNQQSLSYKLFSFDDPRSLMSTIFANSGPTLSDNVGLMISHFSSIFSSLAKLPQYLFDHVSAQSTTAGYNYPFPTYGFSESDLDNPAVDNGYSNANYVTTNLLETNATTSDGSGRTYIQKAEDCFGVTIAPDSSGLWDVTAPQGGQVVNAYVSSYGSQNCDEQAPANCNGSTSDACNWLRLRFFILDTETWNSMGCYAGDSQACSDIGFNTGA